MIRITGLHKSFEGCAVLGGIDASVAEGKIVALLGASGSGKSTLLRCLNGLSTFDAGSLEIAGFSLKPGAQDPRTLHALRAKVGMVFQEFHLFSHLSVLDNVTLAPRIARGAPRAKAEAHARELLAQVGLSERARAMPRELSGGQKQRVAIARALANNPPVLLADEPTGNLDSGTGRQVIEMLVNVNRSQGRTVVLVTHDPELAALADEVIALRDGRVVDHRVNRAAGQPA